MATRSKQLEELAKKLAADLKAGNVTACVLCWSVEQPGAILQKGAVTGDPINMLRCYKTVKNSIESRIKNNDVDTVMALLERLDNVQFHKK